MSALKHVASYRERSLISSHDDPCEHADVHRSLLRARNSISGAMRVLALAGDRAPRHLCRYADCAQALLCQATTALAEAAVHVVGIRTFTTDIVLNRYEDPRREIQRLHHLATQLWWNNSPRLPGAKRDAPQGDDELAAMMWAYSIDSTQEGYASIAKATAGLTLLALGAVVSPPAAIVCAAAIGAGSLMKSQ